MYVNTMKRRYEKLKMQMGSQKMMSQKAAGYFLIEIVHY